ncbi:MAG: hypothetical protein ACFCUM_11605 [Bacteroidales bacterium]
MKKKKIFLIFSLVLLSLITPPHLCNAGAINQLTSIRTESVHVQTDKDVYFAGDRIFFKAYLFRDAAGRSGASQVTYVSLTDETGHPVSNIEIFSRDGNFHQNILLPGTLKTGSYKIDAWTSRMLSEGTAPFSKQIVIINRFDPDINLFIAGNQPASPKTEYSVQPETLQSFEEVSGEIYLLPQPDYDSTSIGIFSAGDNQIALLFYDPANAGKERTIMVLQGGIAIWERNFLLTDSSQVQKVDSEMFKGGQKGLMILDEYDQKITSVGLINITEDFPVKVKTDKQVYNTRERVTLSFETAPFTVRSASLTATRKENLLSNSPDISVSFYLNQSGAGTASDQELFILDNSGIYPGSTLLTGLTEHSQENPELNVIPETEGPVISGKVTGINGDPLENAVVFLSVTDFIANLQYSSTNDDGSFSFLLNEYYQDKDLYLTLFNAEDFDEPYRISLREKFSPEPFIPRKVNFDNGINEYLDETIFVKRVQQAYKSDQRDFIYSSPMKAFHPGHYVYRIPTRRITPGDFIPFDNFPEIAFEIIPGLRFRGDEDDPDPELLCSRTGEMLPVKKSFFMNGVYVPELKKILNLTSDDISTIELLSMRWSFGSIEFPGIISIINKEKLHELPDYSGYTVIKGNPDRQDVRYNQAIHSADVNNANVPDFRETLYWEPSVRLNRGTPSDVTFFTSDLPGDYLIVVEGITNTGRPFSRQVSIEVR